MSERKLYKCHKEVWGTPMNRAAYVAYRGWKLPADEDGADEGYFVEYTDGGPANHPDHKGYISWSPKAQLDAGYVEIGKLNAVPTWHVDRLFKSLTYKFERVGKTTVTGCWSFLPNGFQVSYGESACIDPDNFDAGTGKKYALERCEENSKNKLWELEGFLLKQVGVLSKIED